MLVKYNKSNVVGFKHHLIKPGVNDLPADLVAEMQDDEILAHKFETEELQILDLPTEKKVKKAKSNETNGVDVLLATNEKRACKLVKQTIDMGILAEWAAREKRKAVKVLLAARIRKIKNIEFREEKNKDAADGAPDTSEDDDDGE